MSPRALRPVDALLDSLPRLTLVAGKGGVGKTTCAAALAFHASQRPGRTLLLSTDPAGTLGDALGVALGADPTYIDVPAARGRRSRGSLEAFQLDASAERRRFLDGWRETIVTIIDRGTYLDLDDITGLVDAAMPGADEIFAVLRLGELERSTVYDRIIVDTAPTGHTLRLLDLPRTFAATIDLLEAMQAKHRFMVRSLTRAYRPDTADTFLEQLRRQTASLIDALRDPARAAALLVTRSEALVVAETERYAAELASNGIRVAAIVVNAASGDSVAAVGVDAPRYLVPLLNEPPIGAARLLRWTDALTDRSSTRPKGPRTKRRARRATSAREEPTSRRAETLLFPAITIVGGKGGVGKTTAACALAIAAAASTPDVLLISTDPAPSIGDALERQIGDRETPVRGVRGLVARQMDATIAFHEFQRGYQDRIDAVFDGLVRHGVDARHDREILRELFALAPPGIDELYALASLGETLDERRFARVIVDPAPTGHLLRLLQMPPLALDWSHRLMRLMLKYRDVGGLGDSAQDVLAFARRTRRVGEILRDPRSAGMVIVALDEPLVRGETARLVSAARAEGMAVGAVLWNRWSGRELPEPLPVEPPVAQFVAPAAAPPPVGATALRAWAGQWREASDGDG